MKKFFNSRISDTAASLSLLVLRIAAGGLMIPHGYQKMVNFAAKSPGFADPFGIGGSMSMGLTIFAEFFCAILIVVGLLTRLAAIPLIIAMLVIVFYSHQGLIFAKAELPALYLAGYIAILIAGPGKFSLDRLIGK